MREWEISRRTFLAGSAGLFINACSDPALPLRILVPTQTTIEQSQFSPTETILNEIYAKYGILIPQREAVGFEIKSPVVVPDREIPIPVPFDEPILPANLSYEEAQIIKGGFDRIPGIGSLVKLVLIYRLDRIANDIYSNAIDRHGLWGSAPRNNWFRALKYPAFNPFGGLWAFFLYLHPDLNLDDPRTLSPLYKTRGEYLTFFFGHEAGHNFSYKVLHQSDLGENVDSTRVVRIPTRDIISDFVSGGEYDPIYSSYSQVFGWKFGEKESVGLEGSPLDTSSYEPFWFREEPDRWSLERWSNPQAESDIEEAFADDFAISIFYPDLLSPQELGYFQRIHSGLLQDPNNFFRQVAQNPKILLP